MNGISALLLFVGLFLLGGVYSFVKQKQSKSLITLVSIGAALCLVAGIVRLEVWN